MKGKIRTLDTSGDTTLEWDTADPETITKADQTVEKLRLMNSSDTEVACPICGSQVKRLVSIVAIGGHTSEGNDATSQQGENGCACGVNWGCGGQSAN